MRNTLIPLFLISVAVFFCTPIYSQDNNTCELFLLNVNNRHKYSWPSSQKQDSVAIDNISIFKKQAGYEFKIKRVWSSNVDHVAFWKNYEDVSRLAVAVGEKDTDFQTVLFFKKNSPGKPIEFTPTAMTAINIAFFNEAIFLYNFIYYDTDRIKIEKIALDTLQTQLVELEEYLPNAINIRCKIKSDGTIELQGFGLNGKRFPYILLPSFISKESLNDSIWYIFENNPSVLMLQRNTGTSFELLVLLKDKNDWGVYNFNLEHQRVDRYNNKIVVSATDYSGKNTGLHYIINIDKKSISSFVFPPYAKILSVSTNYIMVSLLEHIRVLKINNDKIEKLIDIPYENAADIQTTWIFEGK